MSTDLRNSIARAMEGAGFEDVEQPIPDPVEVEEEPQEAPEQPQEPEKVEEAPEEPEKAEGAEEAPEEPQEKAEEPQEKAEDPSDAPSRFDPVARADWAKAPASVRREVARMERELTAGLDQYKQKFADLEPYEKMAREAGRPLPDVLASYIGMEHALRSQPAHGFRLLAEQLGWKPADVAAMLTNEQAAPQPQPRQQPTHDVSRVREELSEVKKDLAVRDKVVEIERWAKRPGHERFHEPGVAQDMARFLETGVVADLDAAFDMACRLRPKAAAPKAPPVVDKSVETGDKPKPQPQGRPSAKATSTRPASPSVRGAVEAALKDVGF